MDYNPSSELRNPITTEIELQTRSRLDSFNGGDVSVLKSDSETHSTHAETEI